MDVEAVCMNFEIQMQAGLTSEMVHVWWEGWNSTQMNPTDLFISASSRPFIIYK